MSDLKKYVISRKRRDKRFAKNYDEGYDEFKIGVVLKSLRESQNLTQQQLAEKAGSKKSAISRIENHAKDIKLSTLEHLAAALGRKIKVEFVEVG